MCRYFFLKSDEKTIWPEKFKLVKKQVQTIEEASSLR